MRTKLGPRMREALHYIETHPGANLREVLRGIGSNPNPHGSSLTPVDRLERRQLVYDLQTKYRAPHAYYVWSDLGSERPPTIWSHP